MEIDDFKSLFRRVLDKEASAIEIVKLEQLVSSGCYDDEIMSVLCEIYESIPPGPDSIASEETFRKIIDRIQKKEND